MNWHSFLTILSSCCLQLPRYCCQNSLGKKKRATKYHPFSLHVEPMEKHRRRTGSWTWILTMPEPVVSSSTGMFVLTWNVRNRRNFTPKDQLWRAQNSAHVGNFPTHWKRCVIPAQKAKRLGQCEHNALMWNAFSVWWRPVKLILCTSLLRVN